MQASKSQVLASKHANVQISKSPTQAPIPKASAPSSTVRKTPVPAPSPAMVNSPLSPPPTSSKAPMSPPSSISTPTEAPELAQSGAVLDRVGFVAGSARSGLAAVLDPGSLLDLLDLGSLPDLLDLGSLSFWIWVRCQIY